MYFEDVLNYKCILPGLMECLPMLTNTKRICLQYPCSWCVMVVCIFISVDQQLQEMEKPTYCNTSYNKSLSMYNHSGNTPLHLASMNCKFDAVKFLVQKLVEKSLLRCLRARNKDGDHASFLAHKLGYKDIAYYIAHEYYKVSNRRVYAV